MQPSAGLQIGSLVDRTKYDVALYHEMYSGPLDPARLPDAEVVFLTGLQKDFDRQRQLAYFFKSRGSVTVAGGSICTLFPEFATRFFDVVCAGGVDSVADVMADYENGRLQTIYRSPPTRLTEYEIDYELLRQAGIHSIMHLVEASRGCNFRCDFCVIPAEKARHTPFGTPRVLRMIDASIGGSPRLSLKSLLPIIWFIDNNFGNNPAKLRELCAELKSHRRVWAWGALVTQDVLRNRSLIAEIARSKCLALFTGLESLDSEFLESHDKRQNVTYADSLIDDVAFMQRQGLALLYGYMFDPRLATTAQMLRQIRTIVDTDVLPFPCFFSFAAPLLGTRLFWDSAARGELRPNIRLRDLEGHTVAYNNCRSSDTELTAFAEILFQRVGTIVSRSTLVRKTVRQIAATGCRNPRFWIVTLFNNLRALRPRTSPVPRTFIAGTDGLDLQYGWCPRDVSAADRHRYFDPIMVTDANGHIADWLEPYRPASSFAMSS